MPEGFAPQNRADRYAENQFAGLFFTAAVSLFVGALLLAALAFGYRWMLTRQVAAQKDILAEKDKNFGAEQIKQIQDLDQKLGTLKAALANHVNSSNVFTLLEDHTLKAVRYTSFTFNQETRQIDLNGEAASFSAIAQQVRAFESLNQYIERVDFGGLSLREDQNKRQVALFRMTLIAKPELLKYQIKK